MKYELNLPASKAFLFTETILFHSETKPFRCHVDIIVVKPCLRCRRPTRPHDTPCVRRSLFI